jgi:predicted RNA-binding protein YlxR (DUF448 family)
MSLLTQDIQNAQLRMGQFPSGTSRSGQPVRTCVACGFKQSPQLMLRVARPHEGEPYLALGKHISGRSAYVCRSLRCLERAFDRRAFERSLKLKNLLPSTVREELRHALSAAREI